MRSDYPNSNEPSEDPDDAVARWEAYRALMRRKGDIQLMPWLESDEALEVEPASRWSGDHVEHPSFAPVDPPVSPGVAAEPEAAVDPVPDIPPPPPAEPRTAPRQGVQGAWPLSARLFGVIAVLVAGLALAAALMPRHPGPADLASRAAPPVLQSGLGGLAKLAANDAPGVEQPSGALPDANTVLASAPSAALARPASLEQPSTARHHAIASRSCRHCRHAARTHHRAERCSISRTGHRRCHALASSRYLTEARYRLR